jgi:hypothetical protein
MVGLVVLYCIRESGPWSSCEITVPIALLGLMGGVSCLEVAQVCLGKLLVVRLVQDI